MVRTSDGFTFPVDVRLEFAIQPQDAPLVVAIFGDDQEGMRAVMNSEVRGNLPQQCRRREGPRLRQAAVAPGIAVARNAAGGAVEERHFGLGVRIGDVGDEKSLGTLLKTQTAREIALQEQMTLQGTAACRRAEEAAHQAPSKKPRKKSGSPRRATK